MAALQYVDQPGYAALILRRTYKQLAAPGALMSRSHEWLDGTDAHWQGYDKQWTFPSGAKLMFGHVQHEADVRNYESAEFQTICIDELTGFTESMYRFMPSRMRRTTTLQGEGIPVRLLSASNPGNTGHGWVKGRFITPETRAPGVVFMPATMEDMPHIDREAYLRALQLTYPVTWKRLAYGDWAVADSGTIFHAREWLADHFCEPSDIPPDVVRCRIWDTAASEATADRPDPDWTAGVRLAYSLKEDRLWIEHAYRMRATAGTRDKEIAATIRADGRGCIAGLEQERGGAGKSQADYFKRKLVPEGWRFQAILPTGDKAVRASTLAAYMQAGKVSIVENDTWNETLLDELDAFTGAGVRQHDDLVDSAAHGASLLIGRTHKASASGSQVAREVLPDARGRGAVSVGSGIASMTIGRR